MHLVAQIKCMFRRLFLKWQIILFLFCPFLFFHIAQAEELPIIKVAVLSYGTVNWELDVIKHHNLDKSNGFELETIGVSNKNAAAIALQSNKVDIILTDVFWVIKQQGKYQFSPTHKLNGGIYAPHDINTLDQLHTLGVAGGAYDKNWLLFQAYQQAGNHQTNISPKFAAPPLLNAMVSDGKIDGVINFWHYNARLAAKGFHNILSTEHMLSALQISKDVPLLGWVFAKQTRDNQIQGLKNFLEASRQAKRILYREDKEWQRIRPRMKVKSDDEFNTLRAHYNKTLLLNANAQYRPSLQQLFNIIKTLPNQALFDENQDIAPSIFYSAETP